MNAHQRRRARRVVARVGIKRPLLFWAWTCDGCGAGGFSSRRIDSVQAQRAHDAGRHDHPWMPKIEEVPRG